MQNIQGESIQIRKKGKHMNIIYEDIKFGPFIAYLVKGIESSFLNENNTLSYNPRYKLKKLFIQQKVRLTDMLNYLDVIKAN